MKNIEKLSKSELINFIGAFFHAFDFGDMEMVKRMRNQWNENSTNNVILASDSFAEFWLLYPRKINKKGALASFSAAITRGNNATEILDGTALFARLRNEIVRKNPAEEQYTPHPTTWLNQDRFKAIESYKKQLIGLCGTSVITALSVVGFDEPEL